MPSQSWLSSAKCTSGWHIAVSLDRDGCFVLWGHTRNQDVSLGFTVCRRLSSCHSAQWRGRGPDTRPQARSGGRSGECVECPHGGNMDCMHAAPPHANPAILGACTRMTHGSYEHLDAIAFCHAGPHQGSWRQDRVQQWQPPCHGHAGHVQSHWRPFPEALCHCRARGGAPRGLQRAGHRSMCIAQCTHRFACTHSAAACMPCTHRVRRTISMLTRCAPAHAGVPQVSCFERTPHDEVLVLATDGLWDVFSCKVCGMGRAPACVLA
jgi:hypothetical protein